LNDEAVLCNFNEWLAAEFFDDVDRDGLHPLVYALPHGVRPLSSITEPRHYRTLWYAQMTGGGEHPIKLDVTSASYQALREVPNTPDAIVSDASQVAIVVLDDNFLVDGKHAVTAAVENLGVEELPALTLKNFSSDELNAIRSTIP
jgi:hypothetical protein